MTSKDYDKMTVVQLRNDLEDRGLSKDGKKVELIERLKNADKETEEKLLDTPLFDNDVALAVGENAEELLLQTVPNDESKGQENDNETSKSPDRQKAMLARVIRFGLPVATLGTTTFASMEDDAKSQRAKRFGLDSELQPTSDVAKARRAERFGIASEITSQGAKARRIERFNNATVSANSTTSIATDNSGDSEKKNFERAESLKRAHRFGLPVGQDGKPGPLSEIDEKKKARLERFGAAT
ncbi:unnamed protein product, partial [Mesorhabditis belari]|uniref:SAP domain-containing protein n=1 Tax=Mesorhabditis belari TaxID=2138241 RepID=A0AAF3J6W0_9BILA